MAQWVKNPSVVSAVAWVAAAVQVRALALKLPHDTGMAKQQQQQKKIKGGGTKIKPDLNNLNKGEYRRGGC